VTREIRHPPSATRNPQSAIRNPQSAIQKVLAPAAEPRRTDERASSPCRSRDSLRINTACCDGTTCGPTGETPVIRADRRCTSNWRRCGTGGLRKPPIDPTFVLPNRAGSVSSNHNQMNLIPEENPLPATEAGEKYPSESLVRVITDRSCITPQTRPVG
jgi:hypothetical protein